MKPKEILNEVSKLIEKYPERFNMSHWHSRGKSIKEKEKLKLTTGFACGTTHCIGGWIQYVTKKTGEAYTVALESLGVAGDIGDRLFFVDEWLNQKLAREYDTNIEILRHPNNKPSPQLKSLILSRQAQIASEYIKQWSKKYL